MGYIFLGERKKKATNYAGKIADLALEEALSASEIAERLGLRIGSVRGILGRLGLKYSKNRWIRRAEKTGG